MVASSSYAEFLCEQLAPLGGISLRRSIDLAFWRAPERLMDEPDGLVSWARIALAAAHRVAAKRDSAEPKRN